MATCFVDFMAQNKIYGFEVAGDIAREKLVGFELKKNVSIHYKDKTLLDKIVVAASRSQIFDLIKVDYSSRTWMQSRTSSWRRPAGSSSARRADTKSCWISSSNHRHRSMRRSPPIHYPTAHVRLLHGLRVRARERARRTGTE